MCCHCKNNVVVSVIRIRWLLCWSNTSNVVLLCYLHDWIHKCLRKNENRDLRELRKSQLVYQDRVNDWNLVLIILSEIIQKITRVTIVKIRWKIWDWIHWIRNDKKTIISIIVINRIFMRNIRSDFRESETMRMQIKKWKEMLRFWSF